jgi:hypothetical protein
VAAANPSANQNRHSLPSRGLPFDQTGALHRAAARSSRASKLRFAANAPTTSRAICSGIASSRSSPRSGPVLPEASAPITPRSCKTAVIGEAREAPPEATNYNHLFDLDLVRWVCRAAIRGSSPGRCARRILRIRLPAVRASPSAYDPAWPGVRSGC